MTSVIFDPAKYEVEDFDYIGYMIEKEEKEIKKQRKRLRAMKLKRVKKSIICYRIKQKLCGIGLIAAGSVLLLAGIGEGVFVAAVGAAITMTKKDILY